MLINIYKTCNNHIQEVLRFSDQLGQAPNPPYQFGFKGCNLKGRELWMKNEGSLYLFIPLLQNFKYIMYFQGFPNKFSTSS